jgi:hypothetical protein
VGCPLEWVQAIIRPRLFRSSVPGRFIMPGLVLVTILAALTSIAAAEPATIFTGLLLLLLFIHIASS